MIDNPFWDEVLPSRYLGEWARLLGSTPTEKFLRGLVEQRLSERI